MTGQATQERSWTTTTHAVGDNEDETAIEGVAASNATDGPVIRDEPDESSDRDPD